MEHLTNEGYHPEYGVRELSRVIDRWIRGPIGQMSAAGDLARKAGASAPVKVLRTPEGVGVG